MLTFLFFACMKDPTAIPDEYQNFIGTGQGANESWLFNFNMQKELKIDRKPFWTEEGRLKMALAGVELTNTGAVRIQFDMDQPAQ